MTSQSSLQIRKVLTANDLGFTGSHQAGIHIPKDASLLNFFPKLHPDVSNPSCQVDVRDPAGNYWPLRFVYYNGKLDGTSTRNEYRLTRMTELLRSLLARGGDTLTFARGIDGDISVGLERAPADDSETNRGARLLRGGWTLIED